MLLVLYIQPIWYFVLPEIKLQSEEVEHLLSEEANLDPRILARLWLYPRLCQPNLQLQCHIFVFLALV